MTKSEFFEKADKVGDKLLCWSLVRDGILKCEKDECPYWEYRESMMDYCLQVATKEYIMKKKIEKWKKL